MCISRKGISGTPALRVELKHTYIVLYNVLYNKSKTENHLEILENNKNKLIFISFVLPLANLCPNSKVAIIFFIKSPVHNFF